MNAAIVGILFLLPQGKDASEEARKEAIQIVSKAIYRPGVEPIIKLDVEIDDATGSTRKLHGDAEIAQVGQAVIVGELHLDDELGWVVQWLKIDGFRIYHRKTLAKGRWIKDQVIAYVHMPVALRVKKLEADLQRGLMRLHSLEQFAPAVPDRRQQDQIEQAIAAQRRDVEVLREDLEYLKTLAKDPEIPGRSLQQEKDKNEEQDRTGAPNKKAQQHFHSRLEDVTPPPHSQFTFA